MMYACVASVSPWLVNLKSNSATMFPARSIYSCFLLQDGVREQGNVSTFLLDVPLVKMVDVIFLVNMVEILNQWKVSRAGAI